MTPTVICTGFNEMYAMSDEELLSFRAEAMREWGRTFDTTSEVIALQAEYVCRRRRLL